MAIVQAMEKWKERFHYVMEVVNQLSFAFHHVTSKFNSTSAFSDASFRLAAYTNDGITHQLGLKVSQLFKVDLKPKHAEALKFIVNCRSHA